jgi:hypothetical protein
MYCRQNVKQLLCLSCGHDLHMLVYSFAYSIPSIPFIFKVIPFNQEKIVYFWGGSCIGKLYKMCGTAWKRKQMVGILQFESVSFLNKIVSSSFDMLTKLFHLHLTNCNSRQTKLITMSYIEIIDQNNQSLSVYHSTVLLG